VKLVVLSVKKRSGRLVSDTDPLSVFADSLVRVVVLAYCCIGNCIIVLETTYVVYMYIYVHLIYVYR
jgi:hypothetical protein